MSRLFQLRTVPTIYHLHLAEAGGPGALAMAPQFCRRGILCRAPIR
ncbi:MAG: hypothetical protein OJF51_001430 [Nitrospira sp.]|nr:MAG: hypothetical protein OJF51_001430 [Nitrospira sp.]